MIGSVRHPATFSLAIAVALATPVSAQVAENASDSAEPPQVSLAAERAPSCPDRLCPGLGNAFFLPGTDMYAFNAGGRTIFQERRLGECAQIVATAMDTKDFLTFDSMQSFVRNVATDTSISGTYSSLEATVDATANATTGSSSETTLQTHVAALDIRVAHYAVVLQDDGSCLSEGNLTPEFLKDFEGLALFGPKQVNDSAAWAPYINFLRQGSHVVTQQLLGSRFQQWASSSAKNAVAISTLKAKACASVEGIDETGAGWSVRGCQGYSEDQKRSASTSQSSDHAVILGGGTKARSNLLKAVTKETLDAFIDSADAATQPIQFLYKPVWEILISTYHQRCAKDGKGSAACDHLQRAYNLQAAYEAQIALHCPLLTSAGHAYQRMRIDSTDARGVSTYACRAEKTGCKADKDCHVGGSGAVCYCYGPSCFDAGEQISGTSLYRTAVRGNQKGSYSAGVNNSCHYKFLACGCDPHWAGGLHDRDLYVQSTGR